MAKRKRTKEHTMIHRTLQRTENYKFRMIIPQQKHFSSYYFIYTIYFSVFFVFVIISIDTNFSYDIR